MLLGRKVSFFGRFWSKTSCNLQFGHVNIEFNIVLLFIGRNKVIFVFY